MEVEADARPETPRKGGSGGASGQHHDGAPAPEGHGRGLLMLSFSALGIIYGDIGTSPLYSYQAVFTSPPDAATVLSAASLFFWTLTLIVLVKYVGIIIRFDDNGEGGTFALYSLMCRAAGFTPYGPAQPEELHAGGLAGVLPPWLKQGRWWSLTNTAGEPLRRFYSRSQAAQAALLITIVMATAMVVGDGVLTPSISVLSAISGLKVAAPSIKQGEVIGVTIIVLVLLFSVQYMGTSKIASVFSPIIVVWLLFNAAIGFTNLSTCGWGVWQALSPHHAIAAFTGPEGFKAGWSLLAGVMLAITGAEAMYADLGHFNAQAVMLSFCGLVYPCLVVTYMGQASFMIKHPEAYTDPFWLSVPKPAFWPMLIVATAATVVASQALISGVFSIMRQAMNLGVFPPMEVTHTDSMAEGQIYIGQINYMLMLGCIAMVAGFQDTTALGHAYGVAVMSVMWMTSILAGIVMLVCYSINPILVAAFLLFYVPLEGLFLSSNIIKIPEGGWVTIAIAVLVASVNMVWWYGTAAKQRWYRAQAIKNRGLLSQLPLGAALADSDGGAGASSHAPLLPAASPAGDLPVWGSQVGGSATSSATASGVAQRRRSSTALPASLQPAVSEDLGSLSAPQAGGGGGAGLGLRGDGANGVVTARLQARSYTMGGGPTAKGRDVLTFDNKPLSRVPGLALIYCNGTRGLPAVLQHLLVNLPVLAEVAVLLTVRVIPRPYADQGERFLVRRSGGGLPGLFRVVARYGYMERVDHGPAFVRQLVSCLVRFVAQENTSMHRQQQQQQQGPSRPVAAAAAEPSWQLGGAAAASAAVAGPATRGAGAAAAAGGRDLERWSRVRVSPEDGDLLDEALATAPSLTACSITRAFGISPTSTLDAPSAATLRTALHGSASVPAPLLGRESLNRHTYSLQRTSFARRLSVDSPLLSMGPGGSTFRGHAGGGHTIDIPSPIPADRPLSFSPGSPDGAAAGTPGAGGRSGAGGAAATSGAAGAGVSAAAAAGTAGGGGGSSKAPGGGMSLAQARDIELLLSCYRQRAVYIMGRSQLAAAAAASSAAAAPGVAGTGKGEGTRQHCGALGAPVLYVRQLGKGVVTGVYRLLANNAHPSSATWQLPDDQLVLVSMVVRV